MIARTRTSTHARTHARTRTHTHTNDHIHTLSHAHTTKHRHAPTNMIARTHARTHTGARTHAHTHTHLHTNMITHTHPACLLHCHALQVFSERFVGNGSTTGPEAALMGQCLPRSGRVCVFHPLSGPEQGVWSEPPGPSQDGGLVWPPGPSMVQPCGAAGSHGNAQRNNIW